MREILFRGKRVDNGEWVYGSYAKNKDVEETYIITMGIDQGYPIAFFPEVIPETVGQYTGLTDKNGTKIFEGDIIKVTTLDTGDERRAIIGFGNFIDGNSGDVYIGFYIEFEGIKVTITQLAMEEVKDSFDVIGNIHDNPELLKGE